MSKLNNHHNIVKKVSNAVVTTDREQLLIKWIKESLQNGTKRIQIDLSGVDLEYLEWK